MNWILPLVYTLKETLYEGLGLTITESCSYGETDLND